MKIKESRCYTSTELVKVNSSVFSWLLVTLILLKKLHEKRNCKTAAAVLCRSVCFFVFVFYIWTMFLLVDDPK